MGQIIVRPHAFSDRDGYTQAATGDVTIQQLVDHIGLPAELHQYVMVQIGGRRVDQHLWASVTPKIDSHTLIALAPHGGDGDGKSSFRLLATVVLAVYAPVWGEALLGAGIAGQLAAGAIFMAGSLAINALFPPAPMGNNSLGDQYRESPNLTISGQKNAIRPYAPVTRVYGKHRHWPMSAATPFVQTIKKTQYLYLLFDFGYGPVKLSDHRIGDQPVSQYDDIEMIVHEEFTSGDELLIYTKDVATENFSAVLEQNVSQIFTTAIDCDALQFDVLFDRGLVLYNDLGDKLDNFAQFNLEFRKVGDPSWRRFGEARSYAFSRYVSGANGTVVIGSTFNTFNYFNSTPLNSDLAQIIRFKGTPVPAFDDYDPDLIGGGTPQRNGFLKGAGFILADIDNNIDAGSTFTVNGQKYTVTNNVNILQGLVNRQINITPALREDLITSSYILTDSSGGQQNNPNYWAGSTVYRNNLLDFRVKDKTSEAFTVTGVIEFDERDQYELRITRTTQPEATDKHFDSTKFTALRTITNTSPIAFSQPHTVVEMRIKATDQLNGIVDNYSAIASSELDVWTGAGFVREETANPAWVCLDTLRGASTPRPIDDSKIDLDKFKEWADWCARTATGKNETYSRCDHVVDYQTTVKQLFDSMAACGRGHSTILDGKYSVIFDEQPTVPVQLITAHNSSNFNGSRSFTDVPHGIKVRFIDPDSEWQQSELIVYSEGFDENNSTIFEDLELVGVVRQTQAFRDGRYHLAQAALRQELFTVDMDIENIAFTKGDYVQLQHDVARIGGAPGRVTFVSGNDISLSEPFGSLDFGSNAYRLTVRQSGNVLVEYEITAQIDSDTVTLGVAFTGAIGDLVSWGVLDFVTDDFLVKSVTPTSDIGATVNLVALAPAVYTSDTGVIPSWEPKISPDAQLAPPLVSNLTVVQSIEYIDRLPFVTIFLDWEKNDAVVTELYEVYRLVNERWYLIETVQNTEYHFVRLQSITGLDGIDIIGVEHTFKVLGVSATGKKLKLDDATAVTITPIGDVTPPGAVKNYQLDVITENVHLTWEPTGDPDIDGYLFRFTSDVNSPDWESSVQLVPKISHDSNSLMVNARAGSYLIRAIDTSGNLGPVTSARTTIPKLINLNLIDTINESPTWPGAKDNVEVVLGKLRLINVNNPGYYYFNDKTAYSDAYPSRLSHSVDATGIDITDDSPALADTWALRVEVRLQETAGTIDGWLDLTNTYVPNMATAGATWTEWKPFSIADYTGANYEYRLVLESLTPAANTSPEIADATITVDMVDRIGVANSVPSGTGGLNVIFDPFFFQTPSIAITAENMATGDYMVLSGKGRDGFDIEFFNSSNTSVNRIFDWYAKGFGNLSPDVIG